MAGISSNALKGANYPENRKKYNGIEYTSELDLDIYDAQLRNLDPQIGRWNQIDPKIENMEMWSPYVSNYDNPIKYNDFLGDEGEDPNKKGFFRSIVTGFTSYFKGIGNAVANPVQTLKAMASPQNLLKSSLNGATLGLSGTISSTADNTRVVMNEGSSGLGKVIGKTLAEGTVVAATEGLAKVVGVIKDVAKYGNLGDLTIKEAKQIQTVVNDAGRPLEVGGSAAEGTRRGVGSDLPIGKGPGTKSDIDYIAPPSAMPYFQDVKNALPGLDPKSGIIPGLGNPFIGPLIRFEPGARPVTIPRQN